MYDMSSASLARQRDGHELGRHEIERTKEVAPVPPTEQVLAAMSLKLPEIKFYLRVLEDGAPSTLKEISILTGKDEKYCQQIAERLVVLGLFKETGGNFYQALPPYNAMTAVLESIIAKLAFLIPEEPDERPKEIMNELNVLSEALWQFWNDAKEINKQSRVPSFEWEELAKTAPPTPQASRPHSQEPEISKPVMAPAFKQIKPAALKTSVVKRPTAPPPSTPALDAEKQEILDNINVLRKELPRLTSEQAKQGLENILAFFTQKPKYSALASEIRNWMSHLREMKWDGQDIAFLSKQLKFWSEKLTK